jgi:enoyl-CoA hydratase/carnithine racemase
MPAIVGLSRSKAMMLFGEEFSARQAVDWGLAVRAVPSNQLDEVSMAACQRLAALDPTVVAHYKRVLNAVGLDRFDRAIEEESNVTRMLVKAVSLGI